LCNYLRFLPKKTLTDSLAEAYKVFLGEFIPQIAKDLKILSAGIKTTVQTFTICAEIVLREQSLLEP
jgi:hypothetical protein